MVLQVFIYLKWRSWFLNFLYASQRGLIIARVGAAVYRGPKGPWPLLFHRTIYCFRYTHCKLLCHSFFCSLGYDLYSLNLIYCVYSVVPGIFSLCSYRTCFRYLRCINVRLCRHQTVYDAMFQDINGLMVA